MPDSQFASSKLLIVNQKLKSVQAYFMITCVDSPGAFILMVNGLFMFYNTAFDLEIFKGLPLTKVYLIGSVFITVGLFTILFRLFIFTKGWLFMQIIKTVIYFILILDMLKTINSDPYFASTFFGIVILDLFSLIKISTIEKNEN